jgi:hypothetical protein
MIKRNARTVPVICAEKALVAINDVCVGAVVGMHVNAVRAHVDHRVRHVSSQCDIWNSVVGGIT